MERGGRRSGRPGSRAAATARGEISGRIHGTEDVVRGHLAIERGDEPREPVFADGRVDLGFVHASDGYQT